MTRLLISLFVLFSLIPTSASAQSACTSDIGGKSRSQLEAELEACNQEISKWTEILEKTKKDSASFARDIAVLTAKINAAQANIKAKNIAISNLSKDIGVKQAKISELDFRLDKGRRAIADILKKTNSIDTYSLVETLLSNKSFSQFFVDVDTYTATQDALADLSEELRGIKTQTEAEKVDLTKKREAESAAKAVIEAAKREVEVANSQKKTLLAESQSKERTYTQVLADRQQKAAQIRAVLFPLRDAEAIPFGLALQYAEAASAKTGVRPAFILAILQQESNLGANVGSCTITNLATGETRSVKTGRIFSNGIHPTRDLPILEDILRALGREPLETTLSCPVAGIAGYGGAMGPAQFIPSTWNLIYSKIRSATGSATPDPWNPSDAIMAMALFLEDLIGTTGDPYIDERTAACRYYSGRTCYSGGRASVGLSYGNQVMSRASNIQLTMIDPLKF